MAITYVISLVTLMYVSRVLQPESIGRVNFSISVISYFTLFAGMGIPMYGFRSCAALRENKTELSSLVKELILTGLLFSVISCGILYLLTFFVPRLHAEQPLIIILSTQMFFQAIGCEWLFRALEQFKKICLRNAVIKIIFLILTIIWVRNEMGYIAYALLLSSATVVTYIYNFFDYQKYIDIKAPLHKHFIR